MPVLKSKIMRIYMSEYRGVCWYVFTTRCTDESQSHEGLIKVCFKNTNQKQTA